MTRSRSLPVVRIKRTGRRLEPRGSSWGYISHLREMVSHDLTMVDPDSIPELQALPEFFWMVEFSLPPLYTGNRSKLGEVIISAANDATYNAGQVIGIRVPGVLLLQSAPGQFKAHPCNWRCILRSMNAGHSTIIGNTAAIPLRVKIIFSDANMTPLPRRASDRTLVCGVAFPNRRDLRP
jgi:hypothetical protein